MKFKILQSELLLEDRCYKICCICFLSTSFRINCIINNWCQTKIFSEMTSGILQTELLLKNNGHTIWCFRCLLNIFCLFLINHFLRNEVRNWWKVLNNIFWRSGGFWILKSLELENTNFTRFVSFPFVEKLPNSNLFWQNFEAFISSKDYKDKLCSFCKLLVWWKSTQIFLLTKLMTFEDPRIWKNKLCSFCHLPVWWKTTQKLLLITLENSTAWKSWKYKNDIIIVCYEQT